MKIALCFVALLLVSCLADGDITCANVRCAAWTRCVEQEEQCDLPSCPTRPVCVPIACPLIYDPVCGKDGRTYGNTCELGAAGAEFDYRGECK